MAVGFKIQDKKEESKEIEKPVGFAGVYFSVKLNGIAIPLPKRHNVGDGGLAVHLGSDYRHEISRGELYLTHFGLTMAKDRNESDLLMSWKPQLESVLIKLAKELTKDLSHVPITRRNLLTGELMTEWPCDPIVEYAFIDPKVEKEVQKVTTPSCLFFGCSTPMPAQEIVGVADGLTIRFSQGTESFNGDTLTFGKPGWIGEKIDCVDKLRAKFSDAVIEAAFKDLASKWLALDPTPEDAIEWTAVTTTSTTLV